jgi:putative membrane protein
MGSADIIPGVSGGTIALITGIYERLIDAIKSIDLMFIPYSLKGFVDKKYFKKAKENLLKINFRFLLPLVCGIGMAFLLLARVILPMLKTYPTFTSAFFFGLILSSSTLVYRDIKSLDKRVIISLVIGFLFAYFFVGLEAITMNHSLIVLFFSGVITICAMILPGISGAFIMWFLGQYRHMLDALNNFYLADISAYLIGGVLGLLAFSRFLSYLIKKHRVTTLSFLMGLMLGALKQPTEIIIYQQDNIYITFLSGLLGFLIVFIVGYYKFHAEEKKPGSL